MCRYNCFCCNGLHDYHSVTKIFAPQLRDVNCTLQTVSNFRSISARDTTITLRQTADIWTADDSMHSCRARSCAILGNVRPPSQPRSTVRRPEMSDIDVLLIETRSFPPPPQFRAAAFINSPGVAEDAARDPEAYWAK